MDAEAQAEDNAPSASDEEADRLYRCLLNLDSVDDALRTEAYQILLDYGAVMPAADGKSYGLTRAGYWLCDRWNVHALPKRCQTRMFLTLISLCRSPKPGNRKYAAIRLAEWKGILSLPVLLGMIDDSNFLVRTHIVHLIKSLGDTTSLPIAILTEPAFSETARARIFARLVSGKYHSLLKRRLVPVMPFDGTPEEVCISIRNHCDRKDVREAALALLPVFEGGSLLRGSDRDETSVLLHSHTGPASIDSLLRPQAAAEDVLPDSAGDNAPPFEPGSVAESILRDSTVDTTPSTSVVANIPIAQPARSAIGSKRRDGKPPFISYFFSTEGRVLPVLWFVMLLFEQIIRTSIGSPIPVVITASFMAIMMLRRVDEYDNEVSLAVQRKQRLGRIITVSVLIGTMFWFGLR